MAKIENIAVIGLGLMGTPFATLLLKAGFHVTGYDIIKKKISNLTALGLKPAKTPKDAARGADLIILSLVNWDIILEVVEGKNGILESAEKGQIILDTSTVPPWETKAMAKRLARLGIHWMDVPVCGSSAKAKKGDMIFMAGGKKSVYNKIQPVLDRISKKTIYAGKHGQAAMLKLVHNQILYLNQIAAIEGFAVGLKAGLDPEVMLDLLFSADASSDIIKARGRDMLQGNFEAKGPVRVAIKDVETILENAKRLGVIAPAAGLYHQLLLQARYNDWDENDATAVLKRYEDLAGIKNKKPL